MSREEAWSANEIEVTVSGFFTTHHRLEAPTGTMGEITMSGSGRKASFLGADGRELALRQPKWWRNVYEVWEGDAELGAAWPQGFFSRQIVVEYGGRRYTLKPAGFWSRGWHLVDEVGNGLFEIKTRGLRRGARLGILAEIDIALLVFAYYLVHMRWQSEAAAAAASAY